MNRFAIKLAATLSLLVLALPCICAAQGSSREGARKFDEFGELQMSDLIARLDNFAIQLQQEPATRGFIIIYRARRDLPGLNGRYATRMKRYMVDSRGISADRLVTIDGGVASALVQELWIVPVGAAPKPRDDVYTGPLIDTESAWKFDEHYYPPRRNQAESGYYTAGSSLDAYAEALRKYANTHAFIIAYPQYHQRSRQLDPPGTALRMLKGSASRFDKKLRDSQFKNQDGERGLSQTSADRALDRPARRTRADPYTQFISKAAQMIEDLSAYHHPLTDLFAKSGSRNEWGRYRLSEDQVEFYVKHGYLAGIRMLDEDQVDALVDELTKLTDSSHPAHSLFYEYHSNESTDPTKVLFHALGAWRITRGFHDVLWNPAFTVAASQLIGGAVRFWHDQLFCKPAHHGGVVAWHQDYSYWTRTQPIAHLSCWIGLDDATRENGCLHYVPGSHRWNLLPITGLADDMNAIQSVLSEEQKREFKPVAIELKRGEASFHHPLMVHGSYENRTERQRRATVINVFRDGVVSASDGPLLEGVSSIRAGEKLDGQFFPLLFDPGEE